MVKTKDELLNAIKQLLPDDSTDEALKLFDDLSDTIDDNNKEENENWKARYEENDKAWRERYRDRFFSSNSEQNNDEDLNEEETESEPRTFDDLFK